MARILFLCHRVPFPPNKGEKIRAFHILQHLAAKHDVWLGAIADGPLDGAWRDWSAQHCRDACLAVQRPIAVLCHASAAVVSGAPLSVRAFRNGHLMRWSSKLLETQNIDTIYAFSSTMAQYALGRAAEHARLIVDFVDVDSEKWRQYAAMRSGPSRWFYTIEADRLMRFDKFVAARAHASIFVTQSEYQLFAKQVPDCTGRLHVVSNGVDVDYFRPDKPAGKESAHVPTVLFVGTMSYPPNVDAVLWFVRSILPIIRDRVRDARLCVVGAKPSSEIRALARLPFVEVTGTVPDVRPYYREADAVVAPLRIARGIQNKVLEAMAMAKPVVATPEAVEGIAAEDGRHVLIARTAQEIAKAVIDVLLGRAPADLGPNARERVIEKHNWAHNLTRLDELIAPC